MRTSFLALGLIALALLVVSPVAQAQSTAKPGSSPAPGIPDLSGTWEAHRQVPVTAESALCGIRYVCNGLLGRGDAAKEAPAVVAPEEPDFQPWAEARYKASREGREPTEFGRQDLDPTFSGCSPAGPTDLMLDEFRYFELRQFPGEVLLMFDQDHLVRRIYTDGRAHPETPQHTWMGHSIGKYDGDTLVIDTVGLNDKTLVDRVGHPHSDAFHFVERIRRLSPKSLEYVVTIDDPKAYKKPWTRRMVEDLQPPNFQLLEDVLCGELLESGTHYSAKAK